MIRGLTNFDLRSLTYVNRMEQTRTKREPPTGCPPCVTMNHVAPHTIPMQRSRRRSAAFNNQLTRKRGAL